MQTAVIARSICISSFLGAIFAESEAACRGGEATPMNQFDGLMPLKGLPLLETNRTLAVPPNRFIEPQLHAVYSYAVNATHGDIGSCFMRIYRSLHAVKWTPMSRQHPAKNKI